MLFRSQAGTASGNGLAMPALRPDESLSQAEEIEALRQALSTLPEHYRAAVVLCDLEELSYEDAAAALGCAVGTVRSRLHRARAMLGQRLRHLSPSPAEEKSQSAKVSARPVLPLECEA